MEPVYRAIFSHVTRWIYRPVYIGFEQIPATGPVVIVSNHVSYADGLIIAAALRRPVRYVIDGVIYRLPLVHYFMTLARAIPILPRRDSVEAALRDIAAGLAAGDAICIFPEGQLTYTGSLGRFRPGIEHIIRQTPVPVYPVALMGLWGSVFSRKYRKSQLRFIPRRLRRHVRAVCGAPIPPQEVTVNRLQQAVLALKYQS